MLYEELDPLPGASPWVANYWRFAVEPHDPPSFEHVIVPDGTVSISLMRQENGPLGPIVFAGPSTTAHRVTVHRGLTYVSVRLHPAASGPLLGVDAAKIMGQIGLLGMAAPDTAAVVDSFVQSATQTEAALVTALDSSVKSLAERMTPPDPAVVSAVDGLLAGHGVVSIGRLAAAAGLSTRQLRRKFQAHVGLTPKEFARLRRIRHACVLILQAEEAKLAGVSHDGGYADQPHLTREFRGIFGSSPRLVETYLRQIEHVAVKD